jgi:hypothetical protein
MKISNIIDRLAEAIVGAWDRVTPEELGRQSQQPYDGTCQLGLG